MISINEQATLHIATPHNKTTIIINLEKKCVLTKQNKQKPLKKQNKHTNLTNPVKSQDRRLVPPVSTRAPPHHSGVGHHSTSLPKFLHPAPRPEFSPWASGCFLWYTNSSSQGFCNRPFFNVVFCCLIFYPLQDLL